MPLRHAHLLSLIAALAANGAALAADNDITTITRQSQVFSDASASGDAKVLGELLDDDVVFMGEDGALSSKHDIVAGASPPPPGVHNKLVQSDFHVALHGDVAVTSFTDNATFDTYGQVARDRFRSTEVWMKKNGAWKMISSQTLEAPEDPPAMSLSADALAQYVGRYNLGAGHEIRIERQGDGLARIGKDGKLVALQAETRDVLFTPGQPRIRWIAQRDASGRITGLAVRRAGHDLERFTRE